MLKIEPNYEIEKGIVTFKNNMRISTAQLGALHYLKGESTSVCSFLWQEILRLDENQSSLTIHYHKANFKRNKKSLEILADSGFFKMEYKEVKVKGLSKIEVTLSEIRPELKTIVSML